MELNWTTFSLEILNFLVLVWILQHFLYKPVLKTIAARRSSIEQTLADAKAIEAEARALKNQYENRTAEWQQERDSARAALAQEVAAERTRATKALESSLAEQRDKARILEERRREEWQRNIERRALEQGAAFAARLLERIATPELEARLIDVFLDDLGPDRQARAAAPWPETGTRAAAATVFSAYRLDASRREKIGASLNALSGSTPELRFTEDRKLLAGIRVELGSQVLHANLGDELEFFSRAGDGGL